MSQKVSIFIASSAELKEERENCILFVNHLSKSHKHLHLDPVTWEYDVSHGSFPGYDNIQRGIDPSLSASDIIIFMFHTKIGPYTRQEFELATKEKKKVFAFFKAGFSPSLDQIEKYTELLQFRAGLNDTVLHKDFKDIDELDKLFYEDLNFYLSQNYKEAGGELLTDGGNAKNLGILIQLLAEKEEEIKMLKEKQSELKSAGGQQAIDELQKEIESIKGELGKSEELKRQLAGDKAALEQQLSAQKEKEHLKAQALKEVKKGNYSEAEKYLQQSIKETAPTFYELAKIKKLQLQFAAAFDYYEWAARIDARNDTYFNEAGVMAYEIGQYDKAIGYLREALTLSLEFYGPEHPKLCTRYNNLGLVNRYKGDYYKAIEYYEKALDLKVKLHGEEEADTIYNNLALTYQDIGQYEKAISYLEKSLTLGRKKYGEKHPLVSGRNNNLGNLHRRMGAYDKAIVYIEMALEMDLKFYKTGHPQIASKYNNLGLVYQDKEEYDKSITYFEMALEIDLKFRGSKHPSVATRYNNLGMSYYYKKEYDKAISYLEKSLEIGRQFYGEEHPKIATRYSNLSLVQRSKGMYDVAIDLLQKALKIDFQFHGEEHPKIAIRYNNIGTVYLKMGNPALAVEYHAKSLSIHQKFVSDNHPSVLNTKILYARAVKELEQQKTKPDQP